VSVAMVGGIIDTDALKGSFTIFCGLGTSIYG
jgi:hypothetical protein